MQKGIIFDIKRFAVHDGPGIRTTVFFKGCPLKCQWCHNPESIDPNPQQITKQIPLDYKTFEQTEIIGKEMSVQEVMTEILRDKVFFDQSGGGVTFSGGEPLLQIDFLTELLQECDKENLHVTIDTCGLTSSETFGSILDLIDLFLFDLKIMDDILHNKYIGASNKLILENLRSAAEKQKDIIIRFPIIPEITDTEKNIQEILKFLQRFPATTEINLLQYHNIAEEKYKRLNLEHHQFTEPNQEILDSIKQIFLEAGFEVKIGG